MKCQCCCRKNSIVIKELVNKEKLTDEDYDEISELEMYLNEIPDYLALNITTEYQRLKEVLRSREDI